MPSKKKHPAAEALFKTPLVPSLSAQAQSDREEKAQAVQDKTAKLKSQRLAREKEDGETARNSIPVSKLNASNSQCAPRKPI
jgi:hypothetical protein